MPVDDKAEESKLTLHERIGELNAQRTLERQDHERLLEDYNQVRDNGSEPKETKRRRTAIIISLPSKLFKETSNVSKKG